MAALVPLLLLVRQWLGWTYVMQRLLLNPLITRNPAGTTGRSGKPLSWRERDLLVAREVRPILGRLGMPCDLGGFDAGWCQSLSGSLNQSGCPMTLPSGFSPAAVRVSAP